MAVACLATLLATADAGAQALGSQRVGTSAATFLKIGIGARAAGLGQSSVALADDPSGVFHNPATLSGIQRRSVSFEQVSWLADINVSAVGVTSPVPIGGVAGLSLMSLAVDMDETTELRPNGTGRSFSHRDLALGLSYARYLTDRFSFGVTGRFVYEALGTEIGGPSAATWVMDIGTNFHTGFRGVVLAMAIENFGPDLTPGGGFVDARDGEGLAVEYSGFAPPTTFRLGTKYEVGRFGQADVSLSSEFVRPSDNDETLRFGGEASFQDGRFMLRGGYDGASDALPWSGGASVGLATKRLRSSVHYAFSQSEFFDRVDRLAIQIEF